jgi:Protein of unknown function (DUF2927).
MYVAAILTAQTMPARSAVTVEDLTAHFFRVAVEGDRVGGAVGVFKWAGTIPVVVIGDAPQPAVDQLDSLLAELESLSGLRFTAAALSPQFAAISDSRPRFVILRGNADQIRWVLREDGGVREVSATLREIPGVPLHARLVIAFMRRADAIAGAWDEGLKEIAVELRNSHVHCVFSLKAEVSFAVVASAIIIPTDEHDWVIRHCVNEEVTQTLGLISDVPGSPITLFNANYDPNQTELTKYDRLLLKVLYNDAIRARDSGDELRTKVRKLIEEEMINLQR